MQTLRWIVAATIFLALLFLSLQNSAPAELKFFTFASWQAPLVVVVFVAFASGVAIGLLAGALRASRLKRQLNKLRRDTRAGGVAAPGQAAGSVPGAAASSRPGYTGSDGLPGGL